MSRRICLAGSFGSAELQSALSQNCTLRLAHISSGHGHYEHPADCKTAIQQIENLRYAKHRPRVRDMLSVGLLPSLGARVGLVFALLWIAPVLWPQEAARAPGEVRAGWMKEARWEIMTHYVADWIARQHSMEMSASKGRELVDGIDVEGLADQIQVTGAGSHILTIGQNSDYYASPNATYDRLTGIQPSKCSHRDLILDMAKALQKRNIRLIAYLPAGAPKQDEAAVEALEYQSGARRNREFQRKWEQVIREWSLRWGTNVAGWWFDGCYWPNAMYRYPEPPNFESFAAAARAGNPNSAIAFNRGVTDRALSITPFEDYTAGEINDVETSRLWRIEDGLVDGARVHKLSCLGEKWGTGKPRYHNLSQVVIPWMRKMVENGGAITWDVPVQIDGRIDPQFMEQLKTIGRALAGDGH